MSSKEIKSYEITDETKVPTELSQAVEAGKDLYCHSAVGWIDVTEDFNGFRCGVTYGIEV